LFSRFTAPALTTLLLAACGGGDTSLPADEVAPTPTIGGVVSGLTAGAGVTLLVNGQALPLTADGQFAFPTTLPPGAAYTVAIAAPPDQPPPDCTLDNASGVVGQEGIAGLRITCKPGGTGATYTVGGTLRWPEDGGSVQLRINGVDALTVTAAGADAVPFVFPTAILSGSAYVVSLQSSASAAPVSYTCALSNASGLMEQADVRNVSVICDAAEQGGPVPPPPPPPPGSTDSQIQITVNGLAGDGLTMSDGLGGSVGLTGSGATFTRPLAAGDAYAFAITAQPTAPWQTCTLGNGAGTVPASGVVAVSVDCVTNTYRVSVSVRGLNAMVSATGTRNTQLVLQNNGGDDITVTDDGLYEFATPVSSYDFVLISVASQPGNDTSLGRGLQTDIVCTTANDGLSWRINDSDFSIFVDCVQPAGFAYITFEESAVDFGRVQSFVVEPNGNLTRTSDWPIGNAPAHVAAAVEDIPLGGNINEQFSFAHIAAQPYSDPAHPNVIETHRLDIHTGAMAGSYTQQDTAGPASLTLASRVDPTSPFESPMLYATAGDGISAMRVDNFGDFGGTTLLGKSSTTGSQPIASDYSNYENLGRALYVLNASGSIDVFNASIDSNLLSNPQLVGSAPVGPSPTALVASATGIAEEPVIYVATAGDNAITPYRAQFDFNGQVQGITVDANLEAVRLPSGTGRIRLLVRDTRLYALNSAGVWVLERQPDTGQITLDATASASPLLGTGIHEMSFGPPGTPFLYVISTGDGVANNGGGSVDVFEINDDPTAPPSLGLRPWFRFNYLSGEVPTSITTVPRATFRDVGVN
jgi:hypothetical protein